MSRYLAAQEDNHLSNYFVYINRLPLRRTLLEELADPTDDFGRTLCVFHDTQRRRARLFEIRVVASEPAQAGFGVYPTQQAAANAGERALRRFLESEALKQEQGIMADKHSKPPEPPNDNAKSVDRWDDEGGAPSGGRSVRKRPRRARAKRSSCA